MICLWHPAGMKKRILVVDDAPEFGRLMERIFPQYQIRHAKSAGEAWGASLQATPDLAIVDIGLPDLDGVALAELLRAEVLPRRLPIVFISSSIELPAYSPRPAHAHGCPAFGKPFNIDVVAQCIAEELSRFEPRKERLSRCTLQVAAPA